MAEGFYKIEFESNDQGYGMGGVALDTGKVYGGDSIMYYVGTYKVHHGKMQSEVTVKFYNPEESKGMSVFLTDLVEYTLILEGEVEDGKSFVLSGFIKEASKHKIAIRFSKLVDFE